MKKIRLTESDLEKIVQRVIDEAIGDQLRSRIAGLSAGLAARKQNRQVRRGEASGNVYIKFERNLGALSKRAQLEQNNLKKLQDNISNLINEDEFKTFAEKQATADPDISSKLSNFVTVFAEYKQAIANLISLNDQIAGLYQAPAQVSVAPAQAAAAPPQSPPPAQ